MLSTLTSEAEFPAKLQCLFQPKRTKVLWGGRGAGRSWGIARALLLIGVQRPIRVLCAREFQNSITESVHKLLSDQIDALGLGGKYEVQANRILGSNGTTFSFEGIKNNVSRIKSYEGVDYCWVEEAVKVSRNSWGVLIPTIRKTGSEIWMSFNPELETDYTYKRFVKEASPETSVVVKMTYKDNPWFPEVLREELESDKKRDYDYYLNVWEGHCLQMLEGVVFAKELRKAQEDSRICTVPWDKASPVATVWDLGKRDKTAIWFFQRVAMQWRVLQYYENSMEEVLHYAKYLQNQPYTYDELWLPHDGFAQRLGTKLTVEEQLRQHFPNVAVREVPRESLSDGINAVRTVFDNLWFDEERCADGLNALRHYRYKVLDGQFSDKPLHDEFSHAADAMRYLALVTGKGKAKGGRRVFTALQDAIAATRKASERSNASLRGNGWMR